MNFVRLVTNAPILLLPLQMRLCKYLLYWIFVVINMQIRIINNTNTSDIPIVTLQLIKVLLNLESVVGISTDIYASVGNPVG